MSKTVLAFIFLFPLNAVQAEELEAIEVRADKDVGRFTFANSHEITGPQLEAAPTGLVTPAIEKVPGIVSNQNGGPGGRVSFFIRGTESRHVAFTLDGLKINDASNVDRQFDSAFMTSPFLKGLTIHKGPQAVLYGSDAMGGIVDMRTRKGEGAPETRLTLNGGSFGTVDTSLSKDWKEKDQQGTLTVTRFHTDGISRLNRKRFHATERDGADITQLASSSAHHWAGKAETDLLFSYVHGKNEFDGFGIDTSKNWSENDQYIAQQKTSYQLSKNQAISLRNGFSRHQRFIKTEGVGNQTYDGNLFQNEGLYRLDRNGLALLCGVTNEHEENKSQGIDRSFDLNSVFTQTSYKIGDVRFQAGGRADHHSRYGQFFTGSGGVAYETGFQRFALQYSQGFKAPSLYQLYAPNSFGLPVGNRNLVPERNHSWEASWTAAREQWETEVTLFQNRLSDLITFGNTGYVNQGRFIAEGVEWSGKWRALHFELAPSFTHQSFKKKESAVLRRPQDLAQLRFSYFPTETLELSATGSWFSSRMDLDNNGDRVKLNGYEVLDLGARKVWEKDDIGLQVKNVLNRDYEQLYGYSVMPLSFFGHYGHRF